LNKADLSGLDLSGANLSGVSLTGANLSKTNLSGANLRVTNLGRTDLREANLIRVDLSGANLIEANLRGLDLSGVNLYVANLDDTDLSGTNLRGANLSRAILRRADLSGADLSGATLDQIILDRAKLNGTRLTSAGKASLERQGVLGLEAIRVDDLRDLSLPERDTPLLAQSGEEVPERESQAPQPGLMPTKPQEDSLPTIPLSPQPASSLRLTHLLMGVIPTLLLLGGLPLLATIAPWAIFGVAILLVSLAICLWWLGTRHVQRLTVEITLQGEGLEEQV
jgi:hypothetical protein